MEAMKLEVNKAFKRRLSREKKKQEKIDLAPVQAMQPKERSIRYNNVKSAIAEEAVIAQILREPALLDQSGKLTEADFSVALFGKVYAQLKKRYQQSLEISVGVLEDLTAEEVSHVTGVVQRHPGTVNQAAFTDCVNRILSEGQNSRVNTDDDLRALQEKLKKKKGAGL